MIGRKKKAQTILKTFLTYIVLVCFITNTSLSYALPVNRPVSNGDKGRKSALFSEIKIPSSTGIVSQAYSTNSSSHIILIQDRHADELTQGNISTIIDKLITDYNFDLVCLEGASLPLNASFYDSYPNDSIKQKVARFLLKKTIFTGPEFYRITHPDTKASFVGAENQALYLKHLASFNEHRTDQKEAIDFIEKLTSFVDKLKIHIYSRQLIFLDKKIESYNLGDKNLSEFIKDLTELAKKQKISLGDYTYLLKFEKVVEEEKHIDFKKAEAQRTQLINKLTKILESPELEELLAKSINFRLNKTAEIEFYSYLEDLIEANKNKLQSEKFDTLLAYCDYIKTSSKIDIFKLFQQIDALKENLRESLFKNEKQCTITQIDRQLNVLKDLIQLKLTPDNYDYYIENKSQFDIDGYTVFLETYCPQYNISFDINKNYKISQIIKDSEEFYRLARIRDKYLIENTLKFMRRQRSKAAVLVAGGFHTKGITDVLKQKNISYTVILPRISEDFSDEIYKDRMRSRPLFIEEISEILNFTIGQPLALGDYSPTGENAKNAWQGCHGLLRAKAQKQESEDRKPSGPIGKWEILTKPKFDRRKSIVSFKGRHIETGRKKDIEIKAKLAADEEIKTLKETLGIISTTIKNDVIENIINWYIRKKGFQGETVILQKNEYGISGIGTKNLIGVTRRLQYNTQPWLHEICESALDAGIVSADDIVDSLSNKSLKWLDSKLEKPGRKKLESHYILRAFLRQEFPAGSFFLTLLIRVPKLLTFLRRAGITVLITAFIAGLTILAHHRIKEIREYDRLQEEARTEYIEEVKEKISLPDRYKEIEFNNLDELLTWALQVDFEFTERNGSIFINDEGKWVFVVTNTGSNYGVVLGIAGMQENTRFVWHNHTFEIDENGIVYLSEEALAPSLEDIALSLRSKDVPADIIILPDRRAIILDKVTGTEASQHDAFKEIFLTIYDLANEYAEKDLKLTRNTHEFTYNMQLVFNELVSHIFRTYTYDFYYEEEEEWPLKQWQIITALLGYDISYAGLGGRTSEQRLKEGIFIKEALQDPSIFKRRLNELQGSSIPDFLDKYREIEDKFYEGKFQERLPQESYSTMPDAYDIKSTISYTDIVNSITGERGKISIRGETFTETQLFNLLNSIETIERVLEVTTDENDTLDHRTNLALLLAGTGMSESKYLYRKAVRSYRPLRFYTGNHSPRGFWCVNAPTAFDIIKFAKDHPKGDIYRKWFDILGTNHDGTSRGWHWSDIRTRLDRYYIKGRTNPNQAKEELYDWLAQLMYKDDVFACLMARLKYEQLTHTVLPRSTPSIITPDSRYALKLPLRNLYTPEEFAYIWKRFYNTYKGKGTETGFVYNFEKLLELLSRFEQAGYKIFQTYNIETARGVKLASKVPKPAPRGSEGLPNDVYTPELRLAINRKRILAVSYDGDTTEKVSFYNDETREEIPVSRQRYNKKDLSMLNLAIESLSQEDKELLKQVKLIFFKGKREAHYGLSRNQIYINIRYIDNFGELIRLLHHELQERDYVIAQMNSYDENWAKKRGNVDIETKIKEYAERKHDELKSTEDEVESRIRKFTELKKRHYNRDRFQGLIVQFVPIDLLVRIMPKEDIIEFLMRYERFDKMRIAAQRFHNELIVEKSEGRKDRNKQWYYKIYKPKLYLELASIAMEEGNIELARNYLKQANDIMEGDEEGVYSSWFKEEMSTWSNKYAEKLKFLNTIRDLAENYPEELKKIGYDDSNFDILYLLFNGFGMEGEDLFIRGIKSENGRITATELYYKLSGLQSWSEPNLYRYNQKKGQMVCIWSQPKPQEPRDAAVREASKVERYKLATAEGPTVPGAGLIYREKDGEFGTTDEESSKELKKRSEFIEDIISLRNGEGSLDEVAKRWGIEVLEQVSSTGVITEEEAKRAIIELFSQKAIQLGISPAELEEYLIMDELIQVIPGPTTLAELCPEVISIQQIIDEKEIPKPTTHNIKDEAIRLFDENAMLLVPVTIPARAGKAAEESILLIVLSEVDNTSSFGLYRLNMKNQRVVEESYINKGYISKKTGLPRDADNKAVDNCLGCMYKGEEPVNLYEFIVDFLIFKFGIELSRKQRGRFKSKVEEIARRFNKDDISQREGLLNNLPEQTRDKIDKERFWKVFTTLMHFTQQTFPAKLQEEPSGLEEIVHQFKDTFGIEGKAEVLDIVHGKINEAMPINIELLKELMINLGFISREQVFSEEDLKAKAEQFLPRFILVSEKDYSGDKENLLVTVTIPGHGRRVFIPTDVTVTKGKEKFFITAIAPRGIGRTYYIRTQNLSPFGNAPHDTGILILSVAEGTADVIAEAKNAGIWIPENIVNIELLKLLDENGEQVDIDELHQQRLIPNGTPVVQWDGFMHPLRIENIEKLDKKTLADVIRKVRRLIARKLIADGRKDLVYKDGNKFYTVSLETYLRWFAQNMSRFNAILRKLEISHRRLTHHNVTLMSEITDWDNASSRGIEEHALYKEHTQMFHIASILQNALSKLNSGITKVDISLEYAKAFMKEYSGDSGIADNADALSRYLDSDSKVLNTIAARLLAEKGIYNDKIEAKLLSSLGAPALGLHGKHIFSRRGSDAKLRAVLEEKLNTADKLDPAISMLRDILAKTELYPEQRAEVFKLCIRAFAHILLNKFQAPLYFLASFRKSGHGRIEVINNVLDVSAAIDKFIKDWDRAVSNPRKVRYYEDEYELLMGKPEKGVKPVKIAELKPVLEEIKPAFDEIITDNLIKLKTAINKLAEELEADLASKKKNEEIEFNDEQKELIASIEGILKLLITHIDNLSKKGEDVTAITSDEDIFKLAAEEGKADYVTKAEETSQVETAMSSLKLKFVIGDTIADHYVYDTYELPRLLPPHINDRPDHIIVLTRELLLDLIASISTRVLWKLVENKRFEILLDIDREKDTWILERAGLGELADKLKTVNEFLAENYGNTANGQRPIPDNKIGKLQALTKCGSVKAVGIATTIEDMQELGEKLKGKDLNNVYICAQKPTDIDGILIFDIDGILIKLSEEMANRLGVGVYLIPPLPPIEADCVKKIMEKIRKNSPAWKEIQFQA